MTGDGATAYCVSGPSADLPGVVGDFDIRRVRSAGGPSERIGRIAGSRVPVSPRMLQLFLSPDAQWLAVPLVDGVASNLWAFPANGGLPRQLTDFDGRSIVIARSVSWSPDSRFLYAAVAENRNGHRADRWAYPLISQGSPSLAIIPHYRVAVTHASNLPQPLSSVSRPLDSGRSGRRVFDALAGSGAIQHDADGSE